MEPLDEMRGHPLYTTSGPDEADYSEKNGHFIQALKVLESIMNLDAFIVDLQRKRILYITKASLLYNEKRCNRQEGVPLSYLRKFFPPDEYQRMSVIFRKTMNFFSALPLDMHWNSYVTFNHRIVALQGRNLFANMRASMLDLTDDGRFRLQLCALTLATSKNFENAYIKIVNTGTVYEYLPVSGKFVEVKTQKITAKSAAVLMYAGMGKSEAEIAGLLGISIHTVKYHKKRIFAQTGVRNITEATQWINTQKRIDSWK